MKLKPSVSLPNKKPKWSKLFSSSFLKISLAVFVFFAVTSYSYSQNIRTIASTENGNDKIEISEAYPNPATHYIQFDYRMIDKNSEGKIVVYNLLGSIVGEHRLDNYDNRVQISVDNLKAGIYFYTISINSKSLITKKIVVKH